MSTPRIDGIDISHWNSWTGTTELVNWDAVPDFDLIALKATEGQRSSSKAFVPRWRRLEDRGTKYRGAYHWIRSDSTPRAQAEWHARFMTEHGWGDGCFTQLDWETTPGIRNVTPDEVNEFLEVHAAELGPGRCCVYGSDWVPGFTEWRRQNQDVPVWYANYRTNPAQAGNGWAESREFGAAIWQWSSTEPVPGFQAGIDVNHVFDWSALDRLCNLTSRPTEDDMLYDDPNLPERVLEKRSRTEAETLVKIPAVFGHAADFSISVRSTTGNPGWVSVAGRPQDVGKTAIINFDDRVDDKDQRRNASRTLHLPDGHIYLMSSEPLEHIVVDVFGVGK